MSEISTAFGPSCVSYDTVRRWKKKFESGVESIKNAPKSGRQKSASCKEIVSKIKEIIEGDARFTVYIQIYSVHPDQLASEEANWSGSVLFAIKYQNLYEQSRSSNLIGWKLEVGMAS